MGPIDLNGKVVPIARGVVSYFEGPHGIDQGGDYRA